MPAVGQHLRRVEQVIGIVPLHLQGRTDEDRGCFGFFPQLGSHPAALVVFDQPPGKLLLHPLTLFAAGQQQIALHLYQMRRHLDEGAGRLRVGIVCRGHCGGVLVDEFQNGDIVQVHLVLLHQRQQKLQRPLKVFEAKRQLLCHSDHRPDGCVVG